MFQRKHCKQKGTHSNDVICIYSKQPVISIIQPKSSLALGRVMPFAFFAMHTLDGDGLR